jgi:hypothetical protein
MRRLNENDRFDYRLLAKCGQLVIFVFGAAAIIFSYRAEFPHPTVAWAPRLIGLAFCAAFISFPSGIEIGRDFLRVHYLFGVSRRFAYEELDFEFRSMTLTVRVKGDILKRVFGSFQFVLELPLEIQDSYVGTIDLVPRGDELMDKLSSRAPVSMKDRVS